MKKNMREKKLEYKENFEMIKQNTKEINAT